MSQNFLKFNDDKSEVILFGSPNSVSSFGANLVNLSMNITQAARNLGVISDLCFENQDKNVVKLCFLQLKIISKIRSFLSFADLQKTIHAFIYSPLDYCNALYSGISQGSLHHLQLVQNAAVRLITGTKRYEHITPVLGSLHWLPVSLPIDFKFLG